mgnify:CR=1 FL=1
MNEIHVSGIWIGASKLLGRPVRDEPYPCLCLIRPRDCGKDEPWGCPCWGRRDLASVPERCCAQRNPRTLTALRAEAQRLLDMSLGRG